MEADQVGLALGSVLKAELGKLRIAGIDVVQINVFHRGSNHRTTGDKGRGQQEQSAIAEEVLDIGQTEAGLHGNIGSAEIIVSVQNVCKADNGGHVLLHGRKLVKYKALRLCKSILPSGDGNALRGSQSAGVEERVEFGQDSVLKLGQERIIRLLNGNLSAVLVHVLNGDGFRVLVDVQVSLGSLGDSSLGIRDNLAGANIAGFQRHRSGIGNQRSPRRLADRSRNAEDVSQRGPVIAKSGYKIDLAGSHVGVDIRQTVTRVSQGFNIRCSHFNLPFISLGQDFLQEPFAVQQWT